VVQAYDAVKTLLSTLWYTWYKPMIQ